MRIVDVAEFYTDQGGGVKTYINLKLQAGKELGHEVIVIAPGRERGVEERHGGKVYWVPGPPLLLDPRYVFLWRKKEVHRLLTELNPDVVEGSSPWTGGWFVSKWKGNAVKSFIFHLDPIAVFPHTFFDKWISTKKLDSIFSLFWSYLRKLSAPYDTTIVSGKWLENRTKKFGIKNPKAVPFGIDKSFFSPERRDLDLRKSILGDFGLDENAHLFICISRHNPEKRLGTVIKGFSEAAKEKPMALIMLGHGPLEFYVKRQASKHAFVQLKGFMENRDQVANLLASCDYFIHGASAETYGLVVAEAMCSGLPLVVPNAGGVADLSDESYSEFFKAGRKEELKHAIIKITERDRNELVKAVGNAVDERIITPRTHFENLFGFYERLVREKKD